MLYHGLIYSAQKKTIYASKTSPSEVQQICDNKLGTLHISNSFVLSEQQFGRYKAIVLPQSAAHVFIIPHT